MHFVTNSLGALRYPQIDLIRGVQALNNYRAEAERVAADLEARWSANRVALCSEVDTEA